MRKIFFIAALAVLLFAPKSAVFAQRGGRANEVLEVKLASPLPKESPWGRTLDRIAAEWNRITNGQIRLRILHSGVEGSEAKMHLSLASNTIQAAVFTSFGLTEIDPGIMTMSAPFLIRNEKELAAVMKEMQTVLEARLNAGDCFMLAWSKAGFVNIFSKEKVLVPDDLRKMKIASNPEAEDMNTAFKVMGYQVVESDWLDVGQKLATGTVVAIYNNPAGVAAYQLHTILKNMLSTNIAPVLGGIVINQLTWKKIGEMNPRFQADLIKSTRQIAEGFDDSLQKTVNDAIQSMTREGLTVNRPSPAQEKLWYDDVERVVPTLLGTTYDRELYRRVNDILTRFRGGQ